MREGNRRIGLLLTGTLLLTHQEGRYVGAQEVGESGVEVVNGIK
jgi:hypothetical protein